MKTIHFVSHTHWDREWYRTYQQFRFRLAAVIDGLLELLDQEACYAFFTLDGQTIVLDDYLEIHPEQEGRIRRLIQAGKLLIGPWYVLPDEFLEGPEAMIRNLLYGRRGCRRFTDQVQPMERIAYVPDSFGHIGQLPQIAAGFDQDAACLWRGVGDAPTELRWAAPDGTECLLLHLRQGYSNGAELARDPEGFVRSLRDQIDRLAPYATTSHLLVMFGTDHMAPRPELAERLRSAEAALGHRLIQSTLPAYLAAVRAELEAHGHGALPVRQGEMRSPQRAHLLPGVLSARMGIKQWNARCEALLTRYAEPLAAIAEQVAGPKGLRGFLRKSWEYLLQNHPHDSICGCSIDQVHEEMRTRFAWSEQIAEQVAQAGLEALAGEIKTEPPPHLPALRANGTQPAVVVFNPAARPQTGLARARLHPAPQTGFTLVDEAGRPAPYRVVECVVCERFEAWLGRDELVTWLNATSPVDGRITGDWYFRCLDIRIDADAAYLEVSVTTDAPAAARSGAVEEALARLHALLEDAAIERYHVRLVEDSLLELELLAREVPALGYRLYWPVLAPEAPAAPPGTEPALENEFYRIEVDLGDGTLIVTDRATGRTLRGLNRFVDGGDRGDEYTYTDPEHDLLIDRPACPPVVRRVAGLVPTLEIDLVYRLPRALADPVSDRSRRSDDVVDVPITTRVSLLPGVRRIAFETAVANRAEDHRLRVHFPTGLRADRSWAEGHFDVVGREIRRPAAGEGWAEQPIGTHPQLGFVDVTDGRHGVMLINRGLPEYEALPPASGEDGVTLALTLLRCVGWLSRPDLHNRRGHAGPALDTPGAQCPGEHTFHYALVLHAGNYLTAQGEAAAFAAPLRALGVHAHPGSLPPRAGLVEVSPGAVVLTAVKPPEDGEGLIVRVYNAAPVPVEACIRLWRPFGEVALVPLAEGALVRSLGTDTQAVTLPLRAKEIATLRFR